MPKYLRLDQGGNAKAQDVISQKDMNSIAEGGATFYMKQDATYYKLRVKREPNKDPRVGATYEMDAWVPVEGVPEAVEAEAVRSNREDADIQRRPRQDQGMLPPHTDPNFRNSAAAKDMADKLGAGNLALKDPVGQRHDGQPAPDDKNQPNQSRTGKPAAQSVVEEERLERASGPTEASKPAAPTSPTAGTTSPSTGSTPKSVPGPTKAPKEGEK